jgi:hypothetical protein
LMHERALHAPHAPLAGQAMQACPHVGMPAPAAEGQRRVPSPGLAPEHALCLLVPLPGCWLGARRQAAVRGQGADCARTACSQPLCACPVPVRWILLACSLLQPGSCPAGEDACVATWQLADEHVQLPLPVPAKTAIAHPDKHGRRSFRGTVMLWLAATTHLIPCRCCVCAVLQLLV